MLVLLLSLLNETDLLEMADFIEKTFKFSPKSKLTLRVSQAYRLERSTWTLICFLQGWDMELLFLKVIPLTSINSKVFLQGLIPAVDQWKLTEHQLTNESQIWRNFVRNLACKGYLLPGSLEHLGHREKSWIYAWPAEGKSMWFLPRFCFGKSEQDLIGLIIVVRFFAPT